MDEPHPLLMVVDDDEGFRSSLVMLLSACGFTVRSFASGEDFLAACDEGTDACLIIDVHLPGLDGFQTIDQARRQGLTMPALLMTGRPEAGMHARAAAVGLPPLLEKPTPGHVLLQAIRDALGSA